MYEKQLPATGPVHSRQVLQKIRTEIQSEQDLHKDVLQDLKLRALKERQENSVFIQKIDLLPMSVHLFSKESMMVLNNCLKKGYVRLNLDATGGIIGSYDESPVLNHILLLSSKSNEENKSTIPFNVAEMLSVDGSGFNIGSFLRHFKTKFKLAFPSQEKIANSIVTDKSFANINALIESQNNLTLKGYLNLMYDYYMGTVAESELKNMTLIFLCANHQTKTWKDEIFKFFNCKEIKKEEKFFVCGLVGTLMNIQSKNEFEKYIEALFIVFCSKEKTSAYIEAFELVGKIAKNLDSTEQEDYEEIEVEPIEESTSNLIYKSSPFYILYNNILTKLIDADNIDEKTIQNEFYNPNYAKDFVKKNIAFLPLWSRIFSGLGMDSYKRPTNSYIEGYNRIIKATLQKDHTLKLGSIRMNRYVQIVRQRQLGEMSLFEHKVADRHVSRKKYTKKKDDTHDSLPVLLEEWKGKSQSKSTLFFDSEGVSARAGS